MSRRYSRRSILAGMGALGALSPFIPLFHSEAATLASPKRVFFFFTPVGLLEDEYLPTGTETNFTWGRILDPLLPYKADVNVLGGVDLKTLFANKAPQPTDVDHPPPIGQLLCANDQVNTVDPGADGANNNNWFSSSPSIDQFIAQRLGNVTRFGSLALGVNVSDYASRISYSAAHVATPIDNDPTAVFNRLFAGISPGGGPPQPDPKLLQRIKDRKSVLDASTAELNAILNKVAQADKFKIQSHLEAIRTMEQQQQVPGTVAATCSPPDPNAHTPTGDFSTLDGWARTGQAQMDNIAAAFACDLTRVAYLQWRQGSGGTKFPFTSVDGGSTDEHSFSHIDCGVKGGAGDNPVAREKLVQIGQFYATQFAYLIQKLKAIPEGNGTVLDNTVMVWFSEHAHRQGSDTQPHPRNGMPWIMAGSCGGQLKTGRFLQYNGVSHANIFVSICQAMGFTDVTSFGTSAISSGPLAGLHV